MNCSGRAYGIICIPPGGGSSVTMRDFAERYERLFPELRAAIEKFTQFRNLKDLNYDVSSDEGVKKLGDNLYFTEIDIVLESQRYLFIGEAKQVANFDADGDSVLVHQLVRQYVMAKVLVDRIGAGKEIVPFVVGADSDRMKRQGQIQFLVQQGWLKEENLLEWSSVAELTSSNP